MTDPTTRDPAAPFPLTVDAVASVQLADAIGESRAPGNWWQAHRDATAAVFIAMRNEVPALLAEVEAAKRVAERMTEHVAYYQQRAEAAEQVAREAVKEMQRIHDLDADQKHDGCAWRIAHEFLIKHEAHHGARTGESNG